MPTAITPLYNWPKPTEALELPGVIRTLNLWKPAGNLQITVDGMGAAITAGGILYVPCQMYKFIVMGWMIVGDQAGSIQFDIWKAAYPTVPTVADTITAAAKPNLTAQQVNRATTVPTWTDVTVEEDDVLAIKVDSAATVTKVTLALAIARGDNR
jgi:hypothetical protein